MARLFHTYPQRALRSMPGDASEWEKDFTRRAPLQRTGAPEDIAEAVLFIVRSTFMTGEVLMLDGGRTL